MHVYISGFFYLRVADYFVRKKGGGGGGKKKMIFKKNPPHQGLKKRRGVWRGPPLFL